MHNVTLSTKLPDLYADIINIHMNITVNKTTRAIKKFFNFHPHKNETITEYILRLERTRDDLRFTYGIRVRDEQLITLLERGVQDHKILKQAFATWCGLENATYQRLRQQLIDRDDEDEDRTESAMVSFGHNRSSRSYSRSRSRSHSSHRSRSSSPYKTRSRDRNEREARSRSRSYYRDRSQSNDRRSDYHRGRSPYRSEHRGDKGSLRLSSSIGARSAGRSSSTYDSNSRPREDHRHSRRDSRSHRGSSQDRGSSRSRSPYRSQGV